MRGAIAAGHPLTVEAGARVLEEGGNAVDAAVAAVLASFVTEGPLTGPAGGGFVLVHDRDGLTTIVDCFFASPTRRLAPETEAVVVEFEGATQTFHVGEGSVAVPGLVPGLEAVHRRFGTTPWHRLVEPALAVARSGFEPTDAHLYLYRILEAILTRDEGGRAVYGRAGHIDTEPAIAMLELLREQGSAAVASFVPELERDLASYAVQERTPVRAVYAGREILATPAPSRGGEVVVEALRLLEDAAGTETVHDLVRIVSLAYSSNPVTAPLRGTTHVSVVDGDGLAVGISSTLGSGSGVFRSGAQLNNMLGELDVIGEEPFPPGARLPSMMTPTLVLEAGRPRLVIGSAGSVRLAGAIVQVVRNVIGGMNVTDAVAAPRLVVDGETVHLEPGWDPEVARQLDREGWDVLAWRDANLFFGGVSAVEAREGEALAAAGDPRRGGAGLVVS